MPRIASLRRVAGPVVVVLACLGLAGCGSCGHGSYAADEPPDAGPRVIKLGPLQEGGPPVRIRNVPVLRIDAAAPP